MASTAAAAAKAPAEVAPEAQPKKKSKLLLIVVLVVVLLAGGAGAWFFMSKGAADDEEEVQVDHKPPVFLVVDQFTVNLQPEDGQQFLQVAMTLKVTDTAVADAIKTRMPEARSRVLLLLSSKKPSQLITPEGKLKLAEEIAQEVEGTLPQEKGKAKPKKKAKSEDDEEDEKPSKKNKGKKAKKAKPKEEEEEAPAPSRVQAVYFTHFIVQ